MAAYGLYTHIRANRVRSMFLLGGLFFLIYVLTFAGALMGEGFSYDAPLPDLLLRARHDLLLALPWVTLGTAVWIWIAYQFHQGLIDAVTGGRTRAVTRRSQGDCAILGNLV